ncbi:MAG: hypothetical protein KDA60_12845, partial [Planctomycetales bacterium]|nr:hypothetical protein [Planctomycetales bacterium]
MLILPQIGPFAPQWKRTKSPLRHSVRRRKLEVEHLECRRLLAGIAGDVWYDNNANGIWDEDEPQAANVLVELIAPGGSVGDPIQTDVDGHYDFPNLPLNE